MLKSEDLGRWTAQSLARVCEFLGVDPTVDMPVPPNYSSPSVIDPRVQVTLRDQIGDRFSEMVERIRTEAPLTPDIAGPEGLALATTLRSNLTNSKRPLSDDARARLTAALADELMELRDLVDFSIEDWA